MAVLCTPRWIPQTRNPIPDKKKYRTKLATRLVATGRSGFQNNGDKTGWNACAPISLPCVEMRGTVFHNYLYHYI
jgi:hypothetical protein